MENANLGLSNLALEGLSVNDTSNDPLLDVSEHVICYSSYVCSAIITHTVLYAI